MTSRKLAVGCGLAAVLLLVGTAAAGQSAAVPGLGPHTLLPPWDAGRSPSSGAVTVALLAGYLLGAVAVGCGLHAVRTETSGSGADPGRSGRRGYAAALLVVTACVLVPPTGSADHLSYAAYGRIAAQGGDPYVEPPLDWRGGDDPVTSAVQPPWQRTPSVYGPVVTGLQAFAAVLGNGSLRTTVWLWQLVCGVAFLLCGLLLDRLARGSAGRARAAVLWTFNPLLLGQLVLGAHVDVVAVAFAVGAIALAVRRPFTAGLLLGAAVGSKITFAVFGLAICWGLLALPRARALRIAAPGLLGSLLVLVPAHVWSGVHTYDQLDRASRSISFATWWRLVADRLDSVVGADTVRTVAGPVALALAVGVVVLLGRRLRGHPVPLAAVGGAEGELVTGRAVRAAFVLSAAWVLTVPYALPWYDAMVWAPLALLGPAVLGPAVLEYAFLARLLVLAVAYVPGRVVGMSELVESLTLGFRRSVAPWLTLAVTLSVLTWAAVRVGRPASRDRGR